MVTLSITAFISQLVFMTTRTWNIQAVASDKRTEAVISGMLSGLAFIVGASVGVSAVKEAIAAFNASSIVILFFYLIGQGIGTYIKMIKK